MQDRQKLNNQQQKSRKKSTGNTQCYNCGNNANGSIIKHKSYAQHAMPNVTIVKLQDTLQHFVKRKTLKR